MSLTETRHAEIVAAIRKWLERAVIGLNLCPFAHSPKTKPPFASIVITPPS